MKNKNYKAPSNHHANIIIMSLHEPCALSPYMEAAQSSKKNNNNNCKYCTEIPVLFTNERQSVSYITQMLYKSPKL